MMRVPSLDHKPTYVAMKNCSCIFTGCCKCKKVETSSRTSITEYFTFQISCIRMDCHWHSYSADEVSLMKPLSFSSLKVLAAIIRNKNKSNFSRPPINSDQIIYYEIYRWRYVTCVQVLHVHRPPGVNLDARNIVYPNREQKFRAREYREIEGDCQS